MREIRQALRSRRSDDDFANALAAAVDALPTLKPKTRRSLLELLVSLAFGVPEEPWRRDVRRVLDELFSGESTVETRLHDVIMAELFSQFEEMWLDCRALSDSVWIDGLAIVNQGFPSYYVLADYHRWLPVLVFRLRRILNRESTEVVLILDALWYLGYRLCEIPNQELQNFHREALGDALVLLRNEHASLSAMLPTEYERCVDQLKKTEKHIMG